MLAWIQVAVGLVLLVAGAESLVRGASALALRFGVTPLVIGLTVVAYGTSAPELAVSLVAAWTESPGIVVGNVVGSNVANLGLVLGVAALIRPLAAHNSLLRKEVPFMLIAAFLLPIAAIGGLYTRLEGFLLLAGAVVFSYYCFAHARKADEPQPPESEVPPAPKRLPVIAAFLLLGMVGLAGGSTVLVTGAVTIAESFGVSDHVIGLTLIALGTSLPELATCIVSAIKGEVDLVVGNVIGSNIFNVFFILGGTAAVHPIPAPSPVFGADIIVMLVLSVLLVPFILTGARISRIEGGLYLLAYGGFVTAVLLNQPAV